MDAHALVPTRRDRSPALSGRDLLRPVFRHRRAGVALGLALAVLVAAFVLLRPLTYRAEMKILVRHDRVDPVVTTEPAAGGAPRAEVTDHDINSEVALLRSRDLLESLVSAAGLAPGQNGQPASPREIALAVRGLERDLSVTPIRRTALIHVTFTSRDPQQAAHVLSHLSRLYLEKHLAVHRAPGTQQFFSQQAERLRQELEAAEARLVAFGREHQVISAAAEKESTLQRVAEFRASLAQLQGQMADASRRLVALQVEMRQTPERQPTLQRRLDNGELVRELTARTLDLELKRTELLRKFTPAYPPVVELEQQLAQARRALVAAQQNPIKDEASDQNPTHQWLRGEVARVQAEREALEARAAATAATVREYEAKARRLDEQGPAQEELIRAVKAAQDNYLLYRRKAEEARISDALDERRIANVTVAEPPRVPLLPASGRTMLLLAGFVFAIVAGVVATFVLDFLDPRFRTRAEVERVLELPVLAAMPAPLSRR